MFDEFGWPNGADGRYNARLVAGVARHKWSGWCAYSFDGTTTGLFNLVRNIGPIQNPNVAGMSIMQGLFAN